MNQDIRYATLKTLTSDRETGGLTVNGKMTITEVAQIMGVTPKTILRWEKAGKVSRAKRDWRGWRVYTVDDVKKIRKFYETLY
ncbi:MAG: MerR family transcriptional regulator [Candidatus Omnitrophica bacterium]|nr:MerR family transcriptional regulator [Candidatus Omnitrophota bacterium]